jgi:tRNA modification GTPase
MSRRSLPHSLPEGGEPAANTIFALSSGSPPAAVSIIRISGPAAHAAAVRLSGALPPPRMASVRTLVDPVGGDVLDEVLLVRFDGPASATAEDVVELQCHGGRAVVAAVLGTLGECPGLRPAEPGEFTRRAFANGRIDLTQAEGLADLIEAETESQRKAALKLADGGLRERIEHWRQRLVDLSARAERLIDYVDDDGDDGDPELRGDCANFRAELEGWLAEPRAEPLKDGVRIVVAGPPNSGKSSLVNAIAGYERAIVSAVPGTTRDHIELPLALGGLPVVLTDTAGLRDTQDEVESIGVARASALAASADILLWLGDDAAPGHPRPVMVHARADLPGREIAPEGRIRVSAADGTGLAELVAQLTALAATLMPGEGQIALNRRQAKNLASAAESIAQAERSPDLAILADGLRLARAKLEQISGHSGVEDVLDALFSRFCLGK